MFCTSVTLSMPLIPRSDTIILWCDMLRLASSRCGSLQTRRASVPRQPLVRSFPASTPKVPYTQLPFRAIVDRSIAPTSHPGFLSSAGLCDESLPRVSRVERNPRSLRFLSHPGPHERTIDSLKLPLFVMEGMKTIPTDRAEIIQ